MPSHYPISQTDTPLTTPRDSPYPDSARLSGVYSDISTPSKFSISGSKSSLHKKGVTPGPIQTSSGFTPQMHSAPNTPGYVDTSHSGSIFRFQTSASQSASSAYVQKKRPKSMGHTPTELPGQRVGVERGKQLSDTPKRYKDSKQDDGADEDAKKHDPGREDRTPSSVSLKDLPDVMKELPQREGWFKPLVF